MRQGTMQERCKCVIRDGEKVGDLGDDLLFKCVKPGLGRGRTRL